MTAHGAGNDRLTDPDRHLIIELREKVSPVRNAMSSLAAIGAVVAILPLQLALALNPAEGAGIRDAEIEYTIRAYASPLLRAAGLDPDDVGLHIVNDRALNAFVSRGKRIFLTSGLLMSAERPEQVVGVLAHEIGHITGGHLARLGGALDDARNQALIGQIIGFAFGVLSKDGGVAAATSAKGADIAFKNLLAVFAHPGTLRRPGGG